MCQRIRRGLTRLHIPLGEDAGRDTGCEAAEYLFDSGQMLNAEDRRALSDAGRRAFERIRELLGEISHRHLEARWGRREFSEPFP